MTRHSSLMSIPQSPAPVPLSNGNRHRVASLVMGLVLMLLAVPNADSAPIASSKPPPVALTGTTVLQGNQSGRLDVYVSTPASVDLTITDEGIAGFESSATAEITGVLIIPAGKASSQSLMYLAMSLPTDFEGPREIRVTQRPGGGLCDVCPLPAGDYTIYLLTASDVSLELRVGGLESLEPIPIYNPAPVATDFIVPDARDIGLPGDSARLWSASALGGLRGPGARIHLYYLSAPATEVATIAARGSCLYGASGPPGEYVGPGCPGGTHNFDGLGTWIQSPYGVVRLGITWPLQGGRSGLGTYATIVGSSNSLGFSGIWLTF